MAETFQTGDQVYLRTDPGLRGRVLYLLTNGSPVVVWHGDTPAAARAYAPEQLGRSE